MKHTYTSEIPQNLSLLIQKFYSENQEFDPYLTPLEFPEVIRKELLKRLFINASFFVHGYCKPWSDYYDLLWNRDEREHYGLMRRLCKSLPPHDDIPSSEEIELLSKENQRKNNAVIYNHCQDDWA